VEVILLIRVVTSLIFLALAFLITRPRFFQGSLAKLSSLWRSSIPYGLSETFALIYAQVDISLLAILLGDTETGLYTTANRLIIALFSIPNAAYLIVIPKLRQVLLNKQDQSRSYFLRVLAVFLAVGLILFLGVFFAGPWMVDLVLQDAYTFSGELLRLMSVVLLLKSLSFGLGAMIVALGWQKYRLIPQVVTSLLAIGLNLFIIPVHGLTGAASVYILSEGVLLVGYGILVLRWLLKRKTP
jgi:O-antigen/teichoic acid export membrane protein